MDVPDHDPRLEAASNFLLQSPPGEINDVLNDIRMIVSDDEALQAGILPALQKYNTAQFITVELPDVEHQVIISEAARIPGDDETEHRFVDPRSNTSFTFDHLRLEASDPRPVSLNPGAEDFRAALEQSASTYIKDHFYDGVATVLADPLISDAEHQSQPAKYIIQIVDNKYNPSNYWSGRWRSSYVLDLENGNLKGDIEVSVHYYEQGNVQLATTHTPMITLPPSLALTPPNTQNASKIFALIENEERKYQQGLSETYYEIRDKTFKSLRRALPLTKQKLDWEKVVGYKLGAELTASKGAFASMQASTPIIKDVTE